MAIPPIPADSREFLRLLGANGARFLLVGGYAVNYYGHVRATGDMDVWVEMSEGNAERVAAAIREFGFDVPELSPDLFLDPDAIVRMGEEPFRIELLTSISGVAFDECYAQRVIERLDDVEVPFISLEHLKANKRAAGRLKDRADVQALGAPKRRRRTP